MNLLRKFLLIVIVVLLVPITLLSHLYEWLYFNPCAKILKMFRKYNKFLRYMNDITFTNK